MTLKFSTWMVAMGEGGLFLGLLLLFVVVVGVVVVVVVVVVVTKKGDLR